MNSLKNFAYNRCNFIKKFYLLKHRHVQKPKIYYIKGSTYKRNSKKVDKISKEKRGNQLLVTSNYYNININPPYMIQITIP